MSAYKSFALVGAGAIGGFVVDEMLKSNASVKILTRDDSKVRSLSVSAPIRSDTALAPISA